MKTYVSITIPTIALFVAGAWTVQVNQQAAPTAQTEGTPVTSVTSAPAQKTYAMWATKTTLFKGETLTLQFAGSNPPFLGVVDPTGHFFYVVFPADAAVAQLKPLVDSERFASVHYLNIDTRTFKADPYQYGVYSNQRVFTQSGTYTFIMGDNLHIDDPDFVEKVEIQYTHESRPAIAMN